jgi:RNA polymerase sigma-70 factor, ECF subfamily
MTRRPPDDSPADAIGGLYDRFAGPLYRYALMILANPAAAADAVHDVFVSVLRGGVTLVHDERYLRRAVRNQCYSTLRRRHHDAADAADRRLLESVSVHADPAVRLLIEQVLRDLPAEQREVLHLKAFEGMTFQEIAAVTGEPVNTVASRYRYAMEKMRARLGVRG